VFDAVRGHLILWTDKLTNIVEVAVGNSDSLLVLYDNSNKIAKLGVKTVQSCVQELANMGEWLQACKVIYLFKDNISSLFDFCDIIMYTVQSIRWVYQ